MGDRALINQSYGGRQSLLDGEAIQSAMGGAQGSGGTPTPAPSFGNSTPTIVGTPRAGQLVSSLTYTDASASNATSVTRTYLLNTTSVAASYAFQLADVGKALTIRNDATGPSGGPVSVTSNVAMVLTAPPFTAAPTINGTPTVGIAMSFSDGTPPSGWTVTKRELIEVDANSDPTGLVLATENV